MEDRSERQAEELFPRLSLTLIVAETIVGFLLANLIDSGLESFNKVLIAGGMIFSSASIFFISRFLVLPAMVRSPEAPRANTVMAGFMQATTPAMTGLVSAGFVNEWWLPLGLGAFSLVFWNVVRTYLDQSQSSATNSI